ncbi:glycosyltransferase family 4 protein [Thalassobacillus pellis]|uniref:glycosyltransferase family 4 protein n=1 Tax=Thalassobacillus pellis TaxID=748008 RepID=UPI0019600281|nr:glycosyltransferase family 4 protein [Thalassobacillus pellis]MBM7551663.1 glycosyltransferase involved in cell wall biosynthesis [Thalassobacillus pellis]
MTLKKRKKILILGRGNDVGGGTEYIITIVRLLQEKFDVDIHMNYGNDKVKENYLYNFDSVTFHRINMVREINPIKDFQTLRDLKNLMKKEKFDVVHTNSSKAGILGRVAAKITRIPLIFHTVHGFAFHEHSSNFSTKVFSKIEKIGAKCCDNIITVSDYHKEIAKKLNIAKENKLISIPNGLNIDRVKTYQERNEIREKLNIEQDEIAIFTIGRLAPQKGISNLLDSILLLKQENIKKKYHFYIAGSGELKDSLENKVRNLGISNLVTFLGFRKDVNNLLCAADIIAIPSLWEGLSISLLEAMAAKKAIVCTDIGSNKTVVNNREEAIIVKAKDSQGLKCGICELINDEILRRNLSYNAFLRYMNFFSKEKMEEKYTDFYKRKGKLPEA